MITTIHTTRDSVHQGMMHMIVQRATDSGAMTHVDEATNGGVGPSGLMFTCYRRVPRVPEWMDEDAVRSVSAKETYPGNHKLSPYVGKKVLRKRSHASLTGESNGKWLYLFVEGETLEAVNRLLTDIMSDRVNWRW